MIWRAGVQYGLVIFGIGFLLGTVRVLLVVPQLGEGAAVVAELPIMLAACWWAAGWTVRRHRFDGQNQALAVGLIGLAVLLAGEFCVGVGLMELQPAEWMATFRKPTAQLGLAAQLFAAAMPLLRVRHRTPA